MSSSGREGYIYISVLIDLIYCRDRFVEDSESAIWNIIKEFAKTTGSDRLEYVCLVIVLLIFFSISDLLHSLRMKGFSKPQLDETLEVYKQLGVVQMNNNNITLL